MAYNAAGRMTTGKVGRALGALLLAALALHTAAAEAGTMVTFQTTAGDMRIELDDEQAPVSAANFIKYVEAGFYDGTVFHRVIPGFVIQGGGFLPGFERRSVPGLDDSPIRNEADNGLKNGRASLSMARTQDPHSATSQFFITLVDNAALDPAGQGRPGYAVFGRVVEGMDVVDRIAAVETAARAPYQDVPVEDVVVLGAKVLR